MHRAKILFVGFLLLRDSFCLPTKQPFEDMEQLFTTINGNLLKHNAIAADIAWQATVNPDDAGLPARAETYERDRIHWQQRTCDLLRQLALDQLLNSTQQRQTYLLCRGPRWSVPEAREISSLYDDLQNIYSMSNICIPLKTSSNNNKEAAILDFVRTFEKDYKISGAGDIEEAAKFAVREKFKNGMCFEGEDDFEKLMRSRNEKVSRWTWLVWREIVGPPMREPYRRLVDLENRASRRNGYSDIGEVWRDELETTELREVARRLYREVRPLYVALHGVVRFFLRKLHGEAVPERGAIPAHLLGDLWSQNWGHLIDLVFPKAKAYDLDESIRRANWTAADMVRKAEDFYTSLSLPPMTDAFWRHSVFRRGRSGARCHGTSADMFRSGDFRMLYCSGLTMEDLYVMHHELGHVQYYMAYQHQPAIFREGTNSALHETIGDAIMSGVTAPQHLHRLGLINDTLLYDSADNRPERPTDDMSIEHFTEYIATKEIIDHLANKYEVKGQRDLKRFVVDAVEPKVNIDHLANKYEVKGQRDLNRFVEDAVEPKVNIDHLANKYEVKGQRDLKRFVEDVIELKEKLLEESKDELDNNLSFDEIHLMKEALIKIPQIPFSLLVDEYRWRLFEGNIPESAYNREFWKMVLELQGVAPPGYEERGEEYFDAGAKFHVPDNTPYIRYFLSSFLQAQVFRSLCRATVLGDAHTRSPLPDNLRLHRCDIYGSKRAARLLRRMMSRGASIHWRDALDILTGERVISTESLLQYYRPLYALLTKLVRNLNIPIGW